MTQQQPQQPGNTQPLQFTLAQEQSQGAYSIQVPQGWQHTASLQLYPDGNAVSVWQMRDPSGAVSIADTGVVYNFQEPPVAFSVQMLPNRSVMQYMPAQAFIKYGLLPQLGPHYPTMQVEQIMDHPEFIPYLAREYSTIGQDPAQAQFSIASLQFTFTLQGQSFRQEMYVPVIRVPSMRIWDAGIAAQLSASAAQFSQYEPLLSIVSKSFHWNPQWVQMRKAQNQQLAAQYMQQAQMNVQQAQMQALQIPRQSIMNIGNMAQASYTDHMAAEKQQFHGMDNAIAGYTDYVGSGGQVYNVPNDFQPLHWLDGMGQVHGGGWNATPNSNWTPLEPTGD